MNERDLIENLLNLLCSGYDYNTITFSLGVLCLHGYAKMDMNKFLYYLDLIDEVDENEKEM